MSSQLQELFATVHSHSERETCVAKRTRNQLKMTQSLPIIHPYVSASDLQNFCLDDLFADFLDLYVAPPDPHPLQPLFDLGIDFEAKILNQLRTRTGLALDKHSQLPTSRAYTDGNTSRMDFTSTMNAMKRGDPIIYSGYLIDIAEGMHGIPDLLVRNDALGMISDSLVNRPPRASYFGTHYYIPVEIKYSTLGMVSNNTYLTNSGRLRYYKTQLMMYSRLLATVQGVFPGVAYIIGKRVVKVGGVEAPGELSTLGYVDYNSKDSQFAHIFEQAVAWMRRVKSEGREWRIGGFPRELYPNMKVVHPYHQALKAEWAAHLRDITQIWRCSPIHRDNARRHKVYTWDDPKCCAAVMEMNGVYGETVDAILAVNRSEEFTYSPSSLPKVVCPYGPVDDNMYVDFETLVDLFGDEGERIFMIGCFYRGRYYSWLMKTNTEAEELRVILEFHQFWNKNGRPNCLYWFAEKGFWSRAMTRHGLAPTDYDVGWIDLYEPWVSQKIVVKGSLNFKLKSLIRAFREGGLTDLELPSGDCDDGLQAMHLASSIYDSSTHPDLSRFAPIVHYNELDCRYVHFLYSFITSLKEANGADA